MPNDSKSALRRSASDARLGLGAAERLRASQAVTTRLLSLPALLGARTVAVYAATAGEVDLDAYAAELRRRGARTLLPRVRGDHLDLVAVRDHLGLGPGHRGVREPVGAGVDVAALDAIVVPGVAFDPRGHRLGHGGGHYDRLLQRLRPGTVRVGVAFACQIVPMVPVEAHDEPVDVVVTEHAAYRRRSEPSPA